ncbi:MAG: thermonuclease family protein [Desulfobacterales bacterium]|nr:MAG: thermonuclease family protein [Desulfobacterales bacterium]
MMNRRLTHLVICFTIIFLLQLRTAMADYPDGYYEVDAVVNGDTFMLTDGQMVKLIGVKAPQAGETCATQATDRLSIIIAGEVVYLEQDVSEFDNNNRILRYTYVNDILINQELVYDGYAYADISFPDIKFASEIIAAEESAQSNNRGCLWYVGCTDCDDDYKVFISCFIATAAYGSPIDPHVEILRKFRDSYLMTHVFGQRLVHLYYTYSTVIANTISHHESLKAIVRVGLLPFIGFGWMTLKLGIVSTTLLWFLFVIGLIGLIRLKRRKKTDKPLRLY